jgi:hypothetical protein
VPSGVRVQVSPGLPTISMRRVWAIGSPAVPKTAAPQGHRSSNLLPSATFTSGCSWESSLTPNQAHGVRILIPVPRRARQMVSQHIAKVPSARARLGSIPRLSAKVFSLGVRRIRLAAPACRAERSFGASRFESGDTHQARKCTDLCSGAKVFGPDVRSCVLSSQIPDNNLRLN